MPERLCPWYMGYLLANPIRAWFQDPRAVIGPHVREEMTVLDVGCAMGFFSLPMATMVGPRGKVVCVDVQQRMLDTLTRRARRKGVDDRLDTRVCAGADLGLDDLDGSVDFALAFAMVHEVPDPAALMRQLHAALVSGGELLVAEPAGHVDAARFDGELRAATDAGFEVVSRPHISRSRSAVLARL